MNTRTLSVRAHLSTTLIGTLLGLAGIAQATGPSAQWLLNRPNGDPRNSVVRVIDPAGGEGSGSVICKVVDNNGIGYLGVLSAAHVPPSARGHRAVFGTPIQAIQANVGGPGSWSMNHPTVDLSVAAIRYGPVDAYFNGLVELTRASWTPPALGPGGSPTPLPNSIMNQFTSMGFGGTGTFSNGGMTFTGYTDDKRFQNNVLEQVERVTTGGRTYDSISWKFDVPAAAGFLAAEGTSFPGDSGGPYFGYAGQIGMEPVGPMPRHMNGWNPMAPNWGLDPNGQYQNMQLRMNMIMGVHTWGDRPVGANDLNRNGRWDPGDFAPYGRWSGGVALTPGLNAWIDQMCMLVPTPSGAVVLAMSGLIVMRRRRD